MEELEWLLRDIHPHKARRAPPNIVPVFIRPVPAHREDADADAALEARSEYEGAGGGGSGITS